MRTDQHRNPIRATVATGDFQTVGPILLNGMSPTQIVAKYHITNGQITAWYNSQDDAPIGDGELQKLRKELEKPAKRAAAAFLSDWYGLEYAVKRLSDYPVSRTLQQLFEEAERSLRRRRHISSDTRINPPPDTYERDATSHSANLFSGLLR